jgi:hypothetical protein
MDDVWINRALALREPRKMEKQDVVSWRHRIWGRGEHSHQGNWSYNFLLWSSLTARWKLDY